MLTDFTQFVWFWAGDLIYVVLAFTLAGALLLSILHMLSVRPRRKVPPSD